MPATQEPEVANAARIDGTGVLCFTYHVEAGQINVNLPLIYKWLIQDVQGKLVGVYIGKSKSGRERPTSHYRRNVLNVLAGKPYRKNKVSGFRKVHLALAEATRMGHKIELHFICNLNPEENIDRVEKEWIESMNCKGTQSWQLNG